MVVVGMKFYKAVLKENRKIPMRAESIFCTASVESAIWWGHAICDYHGEDSWKVVSFEIDNPFGEYREDSSQYNERLDVWEVDEEHETVFVPVKFSDLSLQCGDVHPIEHQFLLDISGQEIVYEDVVVEESSHHTANLYELVMRLRMHVKEEAEYRAATGKKFHADFDSDVWYYLEPIAVKSGPLADELYTEIGAYWENDLLSQAFVFLLIF